MDTNELFNMGVSMMRVQLPAYKARIHKSDDGRWHNDDYDGELNWCKSCSEDVPDELDDDHYCPDCIKWLAEQAINVRPAQDPDDALDIERCG